MLSFRYSLITSFSCYLFWIISIYLSLLFVDVIILCLPIMIFLSADGIILHLRCISGLIIWNFLFYNLALFSQMLLGHWVYRLSRLGPIQTACNDLKKFKAFSINLSIQKIVVKFFMYLWFFEFCEQSLNPRRM